MQELWIECAQSGRAAIAYRVNPHPRFPQQQMVAQGMGNVLIQEIPNLAQSGAFFLFYACAGRFLRSR